MKYNIQDYYNRFGLLCAKSAYACEHYADNKNGKLCNVRDDEFKKILSKSDFIVELPDNLMETVTIVNRMVKHNSCPSQLKNKFYKSKHNLIKCLYENGMVSSVLESGYCYNFKIGGYSFHQLKNCFYNVEITGTEDYKPSFDALVFSQDEFNKATNGIMIFVNHYKGSRDCEFFKHQDKGY